MLLLLRNSLVGTAAVVAFRRKQGHHSLCIAPESNPVVDGRNDLVSTRTKAAGTANECALCKAVKAGPCRESFYPFEACLERCETMGEDAASTCNSSFMAMMSCMAKHKEAYEIIFESLSAKTKTADGDEESLSPPETDRRYVNSHRAKAALAGHE